MSPTAKRRRTDILGSDSSSEHESRPARPDFLASEAATGDQRQPAFRKQLTTQAADMYGYKSNFFRMETEEMLSEVALNYNSKRMAAVEKTLRQLKNIIDAIPERRELKIADVEAEMKKRKIYIPFPEPKPSKDILYQFSFIKPSYVNVAGSYALKTLIKQKEGLSIDLVLTMPSEIFQEKDYLNYRYFYKRAYYLAVMAGGITGSKELKGLKVEYDYMNGDQLKPILVVSELDGKAQSCTINIIPSAPPNVFPARKLYPLKNCIRPQQMPGAATTNKPTYDPTPFYNASLAADTTFFPYLALLHSSTLTCAAFLDGCILGRVWLRQRGFGGSVSNGGFGHFEWALLMAFLLKGGGPKGHGLLAVGYSNYQLFKAMLQFLSSRNLSVDPLVLGATENVKKPSKNFPIVFDSENGVNVLFKMTSWSYSMLRHEAERTLECLNKSTLSDHFDSIFLQRADELCYKFDAIVRLPFPFESILENQGTTCHETSGRKVEYAERVYRMMKEALNDRVSLIHLSYPGEESFSIRGSQKFGQPGVLTVGLLLNAQNISRATDRGPPPEEKKRAAAFRKFWGSKAELRRFPDGSIVESVTWTQKSKVPIYQQIIRYIFAQHFSGDLAKRITFIGEAFSNFLEGGEQGSAAFQPAFDAFDILDKDLKNMTGLPLAMRHVGASGEALRASSIKLPFAPDHPLMEPADVIVQFESSSRWPDDLVAIQKTKASFLIKMGELLEEANEGQLITRVGLENEDNEIMNYAFLDVIYLTGPVFRIRIYHDREETLLESRSHDPTLSPREKEAVISALAAHRRTFVLGPRHTNAIRQLCHRFPIMSPTIRLVKKWFASQLLSSAHVSSEFLELVVVRSFLYPYPFTPPSSIMTGFLRSLAFLAKWDWRTEPLIFDLSSSGDQLKTDDFDTVRNNFDQLRKKDPAMNHVVLFVASNYDRADSLWTEGSRPPKVVAARITALARAAITSNTADWDIHTLFSTSTTDFDFILQLNPKFVAATATLKKQVQKYKNLQIEEEAIRPEDIVRLGFDPCHEYVREISKIYDGTLILFHHPLHAVVGGAWLPTNVRKWKPNLGYSTLPVGGTKDGEDLNVGVNRVAILNEISRIGGELVLKVVVNRP